MSNNEILQQKHNNVDPFVVFLTGASGAGKTTLLNLLKEQYHNNMAFLNFDSIGVPSEEDMIKNHGTPSEWQRAMTHAWVKKIKREYKDYNIVILDGQVNLDFIVEACQQFNLTEYEIILIHCDDKTRHQRLRHSRNQPDLINVNMDNWAEYLKRQATEKNAIILNTTQMKEKEMVDWFNSHIIALLNRADFTRLELTSERIKLIPICIEYAQDICNNFTAEITRYMWPSAPKTQDEINQHIMLKQSQMKSGDEISLLIIKKDSDEFLGYISIHQVNSVTPELGVWLKKSAHGFQYGFEALNLLKDWVESKLSYSYLKYPVDKKNIPSRNLAEKLGGKVEDEYIKTSESGNLLDEVEYRFYKKCRARQRL